MYCPKCGIENPDDAQVCSSCSEALTTTSAQAPKQPPNISGLAIASLILGLLSFCTLFITALPAIICGIISLVKISKSQGRLKGQGFAIAGIAVSVVSVAILMVAIFGPKQDTFRWQCGANLKQLANVMMIYADDNPGGVYPAASQWCDLLDPYIGQCKEVLKCHTAAQGPSSYAMNKNIEKFGPSVPPDMVLLFENQPGWNQNIEKRGPSAPPDMVLLFESQPGWNQSGGPELLATDNHLGEGCFILFNNGDVAFVKTEDLGDLKWTAEQNE